MIVQAITHPPGATSSPLDRRGPASPRANSEGQSSTTVSAYPIGLVGCEMGFAYVLCTVACIMYHVTHEFGQIPALAGGMCALRKVPGSGSVSL
jgi:hypothetical protein